MLLDIHATKSLASIMFLVEDYMIEAQGRASGRIIASVDADMRGAIDPHGSRAKGSLRMPDVEMSQRLFASEVLPAGTWDRARKVDEVVLDAVRGTGGL